jgi:hypothetical protein
MIGWLSCSLLSALFRVRVLVAGLVTVYLTSTIRLPQRRIPRRGSHISFLGIVAHTSHILQNHECRLPHEFAVDGGDDSNTTCWISSFNISVDISLIRSL